MTPSGDAIISFASALPLALLGGFFMIQKPRRRSQLFFGAFMILWGFQIGLGNLGRILLDAPTHRFALLLGHAFFPPAMLCLVHFAATLRPSRWGWTATTAAGIVAAAGSLTLALSPALVVESVTLQNGQLHTVYGPLAFPLLQGPFFAGFYVALLALYFEYRAAPVGTPRHRVRGVLLALAIFASYQAVRSAVAFYEPQDGVAVFASGSVQSASSIGQAAFFSVAAILLAGIVVHLFLRPPPPEGRDSPLIFAFLFPGAVAVLERGLASLNVTFETLGFWRLLSAGVLVYTLANYQLFDVNLKLRRVAGPAVAGILVFLGIPIVLTFALGEFGFVSILLTIIPQVVGIAGVVLFKDRVAGAIVSAPTGPPDEVRQRRLAIYRVALEEVLGRGASPDDPELRELRVRHGITDDEHNLLVWTLTPESRASIKEATVFEVGATALDRYRLDRLLGQGTLGATFLATDQRTKALVALKTVPTDALQGAAAKLLLREARLAASIDHPNVIRILDVADLEHHAIVVMEYADNGNLDRHLGRGRLPLSDAVRFLRELLLALEAVHRKGIVHRNLKPKNILVEADGSVRLADFGAAQGARASAPDAASDSLLDLLYQSPEQVRGNAATPRSDLYVAAVLFHQALTRRHCARIAGRDDRQIRSAVANDPPELHVGDQPAWVHAFLTRALEKDPGARFSDAKEMRQALESAAGIDRTKGPSPEPTSRSSGLGTPAQ